MRRNGRAGTVACVWLVSRSSVAAIRSRLATLLGLAPIWSVFEGQLKGVDVGPARDAPSELHEAVPQSFIPTRTHSSMRKLLTTPRRPHGERTKAGLATTHEYVVR